MGEECDVKAPDSCNDEEKAYIAKNVDAAIDKVNAELQRLQGMTDKPMRPEKSDWLLRRIGILEQMTGKRAAKKRQPPMGWIRALVQSLWIPLGIISVLLLVLIGWLCCWPDSSGGKPAAKPSKADETKE